jgi:hypothetical protein
MSNLGLSSSHATSFSGYFQVYVHGSPNVPHSATRLRNFYEDNHILLRYPVLRAHIFIL